MSSDKQIEEAEALAVMRESDGWKIVEAWINEAIKLSKDDVFMPKKTKNWNDYLHFRATHNAYVKLLAAVQLKIDRGISARKKQDEERQTSGN